MNLVSKIKTNRWSAFGLVVLAAALTIAYIDNVLRVNSLLSDIQELEKQYEEVRTSNEMLNAKLIELQSAERITKIAYEQLGLIKPTKAPSKITVKQ